MAWTRYFRRSKWDQERLRELESYVEDETQDNIARGMPRDEAHYAAQRKLGNPTLIREEIFHMNSIGWFETLWQDIRFGARMLAKAPAFTLAAVLTLALGFGANTAIFSVVNAVLLRPLPYRNPSQLFVIQETTSRQGDVSVSYPNFLDWREQSRAFGQMAATHDLGFSLSGVDQPENITGFAVSPNFLSVLGMRPMLGRDFLPTEEKPGTAPVAILSYRMWQSHLGGNPDAIGRSITLNGRSFTIVGILPHEFVFLGPCDVLAPIGVWAGEMTERGARDDMFAIGRLAPGATFAQARAELGGIETRLTQQYPAENSGMGTDVSPLAQAFFSDMRPAILVLFGAVLFVLLIACVNVANLFLVRGATRAKEIAVRQAFGASRLRVVRQMLTESFLLAILGGGLGLAVGVWGVSALGSVIPPDSFQMMEIHIDARVLLFAAGLIALVTLAFGLVPALQASRPDVQGMLKESGRSSTPTARQHRVRGALAVVETALALVLLAGAGLMMKSLYLLLRVNPGFQPDRVLHMELNLRSAQYAKGAAMLNFWQQTLDRVHALPGVESAAVGTNVPLTDNHYRADITIEGQAVPSLGQFPHPDYHVISSEYIRALSIPLLRGRTFEETDTENAPLAGLINATMAKRYWPSEDAVGKRFHFGRPGPNDKWITIVGVVGDTRLYGLANAARLEVYVPFRQRPMSDMGLLVRSAADPAGLTSAIRAAVAAVDKDQPLFYIETMNQVVSDSVSTRRVTLILLGLFSALALVLATIGIYGVVSYSVALRTHEIGIRMALGAQHGDVLQMILGQGVRLALLGVGIGLAAALALTRLLSSLLFSVSASDPLTFAGVAALLIGVSLVACYIPARRAMRVDPMVALRYE